ncbi:MAG: universal stress protein [Chloroflexi bacterium]|nr:universal stress protein [Chloroflexota bacterium]
MFKHILVPLDGSKLAEEALPYAISLATQYEAKVLLVRAIPKTGVPAAPLNVAAVEKAEEEEAATYLLSITNRVRSSGVVVESLEEVGENASEVLLEIAQREGIDLIVGVSRGRSGLSRTVYGSVIDDLARDPRQPVLVIKGSAED